MLRILGVFLLVFWLLSIVVRMDGMAEIFAMIAMACFAVDLAFDCYEQHRQARRGHTHVWIDGQF